LTAAQRAEMRGQGPGMSWQAYAGQWGAGGGWRLPRPLDGKLSRKAVELTAMFTAAMFFAYVFLAVKFTLAGDEGYHFGDFFALWTSAVVTHAGDAAVNFDPDALHARQVALGMNPDGYNPFPYPPSFLLLLGPLGRLPLHLAFYVVMVPAFLAYVAAMAWGRWREWWWPLAACIAPATGITLISGQTGYLSGALMVGALRLLPVRPALAGVLFGLLTYKPQLGVLVPVALVAMGGWRAIGAATATFAAGVLASGYVYGFAMWGLWAHSIVEYATRFHPVVGYMPTVYANAIMLGAWRSVAWGLQLAVSMPVGVVVWRAFRDGPTPRAAALLIIGTYLATPHAFNYDMPMMTLALTWYFVERHGQPRPFDLGEIVALLLAFTMPFLMLELKKVGMPMSWAPLGLMFCLIAWPRAPEREPASEAIA
jgi:hypothetical protein